MIGSNAQFSAAFEKFLVDEEVTSIMASFDAVKACLPLDDHQPYSYKVFRDFALPLLSYKRKSLIGAFDCKITASDPVVVISGAGPVGLRAAVEAKLTGFRVIIVELRGEFSRHNVIKTWNYTIADLMSLGLSHYYPQFSAHGNTLHLGIKEIQMCLLKAALILGVEVQYQVGVCGIVDPATGITGGKWAAWTLPASEARLRLKKRAELDGLSTEEKKNRVDYFESACSEDGAVVRTLDKEEDVDYLSGIGAEGSKASLIPFDYFFVAEGESSRLIRHLGFDRKVWKFANMIGIVVNFDITPSELKSAMSAERSIPEFLVTRAAATWKSGPLGKLDKLGYELENMEYMRSFKTHFFVVTIKKNTLKSSGIVKEDKSSIKELLDYTNLDIQKLESFARDLGNVAGVPQTCPLSKKHGVQIFDFSCKGQCTSTLRKFTSRDPSFPETLILPIGDALQNPYWPYGLGVNRGFHSAFDAVHAIHIAETQSFDTALFERITAFRAMEWYPLQEACLIAPVPSKPGIKTAGAVTATEHNWTIDPLTRYNKIVFKGIHFSDIQTGSMPTLPKRVRKFWGFQWNTGGSGVEGEKETDEAVLYPEDQIEATVSRLALTAAELAQKPATQHTVPSPGNF
ncbi:hypothetical protein BCR33DRAFT_721800 [Rhizoclosmatium globosum]|uniref:[F-actin]-monooxygenase MICAL1-3-like Rossman domain-containing protein n=1 Tax=Rhizoclosmatium globosum TaxID=329046 RepID=A0A1Y2BQ44_9FUNG|nr:hypothetical protein BCR33DRAFT_721800 [Rhizoclosmatium globosum]|eukprot:ORY36873.1 hypothetical protein BCR33DRAFT_721800 [Rhizoclosmatium globosum]